MLAVNIVFTETFFKEYSESVLMICRLIDFALVVLQLLVSKFVQLLESQK